MKNVLRSYGIIPVQKSLNGYLFLLVHNINGHWEFPKGTPNGSETPEQTALREFQEESGITNVHIIPNLKLREEYMMPLSDGTRVPKEVILFIGVVDYPKRVNGFHGDVDNAMWLPYEEAIAQLTFPESKQVLKETKEYLDGHLI
jgi:8-oxo-dGTP pyrophosphatase MutT (NUDIX family)